MALFILDCSKIDCSLYPRSSHNALNIEIKTLMKLKKKKKHKIDAKRPFQPNSQLLRKRILFLCCGKLNTLWTTKFSKTKNKKCQIFFSISPNLLRLLLCLKITGDLFPSIFFFSNLINWFDWEIQGDILFFLLWT